MHIKMQKRKGKLLFRQKKKAKSEFLAKKNDR